MLKEFINTESLHENPCCTQIKRKTQDTTYCRDDLSESIVNQELLNKSCRILIRRSTTYALPTNYEAIQWTMYTPALIF